MLNRVVREKPADMTISMHTCRGNFRSRWAATGGYEPVAEAMFNIKGIDAYFMEYDSDRAGGFEPLRYLPKDKIVVLGLITCKTPQLEDKDLIKRRIDQAAKFVDLAQLRLSPQCGFASTGRRQRDNRGRPMAKTRTSVRHRPGGLEITRQFQGRGTWPRRTPTCRD